MKLQTDHSWTSHIWNWQIPLKLKFFIWLAGKEKILSWEALRHRGWEGPGICPLCKLESEDVHHLMVHCIFTKEVWHLLTKSFPQPVDWRGPTLSACFRDCITQKSASPCLAVHICWQIWKERNYVIFEGHPPSIQAVAHRVWATFHGNLPRTRLSLPRAVRSPCLMDTHWRASMELLLLLAYAAGLVVSSRPIKRELLSGSLTVGRAQIQKQSCWVYGQHSHLPPNGRLITF
jgi:hypothetical protein